MAEIKQSDNTRPHMVMQLVKETTTIVLGREIKIKTLWADGMIGVIPVFDSYASALEYSTDGDQIIEIAKKE